MPTLSRKLYKQHGITVFMYPNDHPPAHVHVTFGSYEAKYTIDGRRVDGKLPKVQEKLLRAWLLLNTVEVIQAWDSLREGVSVEPID